MSSPPSSSTNDFAIMDQITNVLIYIGNTFVDQPQRTIYTGSINKEAMANKTQPSELKFVEALIKGYVDFKTRYNTSLPATVDNSVLSKIMIRQLNDATYRPIGSTINSGFSPTTMELNYSKLLTPVPGIEGLLDVLDKIKNTYTFLSENTLKKYKSGVEYYVSNYMIDAENKSHVLVTSENKTTILSNIEHVIGNINNFDFVNNDVFIIRRLLLLYELLSNIYISMYLYEKSALSSQASDTLKKALNNNLSNAGNILINLNQNFTYSLDENLPIRSSIIKDLNQSIKTYNANSENINVLDNNVKDLKIALTNNKNLLDSGLSVRKTSSKYENIVRILLIVSVIAIVATAIVPLERSVKLYLIGSVFVIVIVTAVLLDWIYRRRIEGFEDKKSVEEGFYVCSAGATLPSPSNSSIGCTVEEVNSILINYNRSYLNEALNFLTSTIYLGLIFQSNRTYTGMDAAIQREVTYFNQMQDMIGTANTKVSNTSMIVQLDTITSTARVTFFISLAVIITAAVFAYIIVGDDKTYQPLIIGIAGILVIISLMKYLYNTMRRVRTDPVKYYWEKPTNIDQLSYTSAF